MRTKNLINSLYLKKKTNVKEVDEGRVSREDKKKQERIQSHMATESKKLKFQVVTYNVAELTKPDGADLTPILALEDKPDVISIG